MTKFEFRKVFYQTVISAVLSFLTFGFSFVRVYYFSKKLSVEEFGVLSLLLTISAFLMYIFTIGSYQYLFKNLNGTAQEQKEALWSSVFITGLIGSIAVLITWFFKDGIAYELNLQGYSAELFQTVCLTASTSVMTIFLYYHYGKGRNNFQNFLQFLRGSLWIIVAIAFSFVMNLDLSTIFIVINVSMLFILLISVPFKQLNLLMPFHVSFTELKKLFRYCVPLLPYFAGVWGIPMLVRTQLNIYNGAREVALFSVAYTLMEIVFMFISTITATLSPYFFAEESEEGKPEKAYNIMLKYSILGIVMIIPFIEIARFDLIDLITSEEYRSAGEYMPLLMFFPLIRVMIIVFEQVYLKESKTMYLGIVYSLAMVLAFVLSLWLIPSYSVMGAIVSSLIAYLTVFLLLLIKQTHKIDPRIFNIKALLAFSLVVVSVTSALSFVPIHNFIKWLPLIVIMLLGLNYIPVLTSEEKQKILGFLKIKNNG